MNKKVLHVFVNSFFATGKSISGGDVRIVEFINNWTSDKKDFDIVLYSPSRFSSFISEKALNEIEVRDTTEPSKISNSLILTYIYRVLNIKKHIKCNTDDTNIFYSSSDYFPDILPAMKSARKYKGKWYATVHHIIEAPNSRPGNRLRNFIAYLEQQISLRFIIKNADKIFVVSPLVGQFFLEHGVASERIERVLNGVNIDYIDSIEPEATETFDGVFFARLAPSKGIYELSDIWAKVCSIMPDARLAIIGGASESVKQDILSMFSDRGISGNVKLFGFLDYQDAYSIMKSSKVFVFPSHEEGWGITIAEAMACKLPVVSYALPVFPHVFPGLLCSVGFKDTDAFSDSIIKLLNDERLREEMSYKGYDFVVNNYSWNKASQVELEALEL